MKPINKATHLSITMWHGGRKWQWGPEIMQGKKGQTERGPGIYCTSHYMTASKYAKGGGQVRRLVIEPRELLEDIAIPLADAIGFVKSHLIRRTHEDIMQRLSDCSERLRDGVYTLKGEGPHVPLSVLNNLCINSDQAHGERGLELNKFLVSYGADASFDYASGREVWGCIFNPECIKRHEVMPASAVDKGEYELPDPVAMLRERKALRIAEEEVLASKAVIAGCAEDGKVAVVWNGRDCDGVAYSGKVSLVEATHEAVTKHIDHTVEWADGPCYFEIMSPSQAKGVEPTQRDLTMEAFEDGHPHSLRY
jgi:hypothetical protein